MNTATVVRLPERKTVDVEDTWDLSKLFANDDAWETGFNDLKAAFAGSKNSKGDCRKCRDAAGIAGL